MLQTPTTAPSLDGGPRALADLLAGMADSQQDHEITTILRATQRALERIAYNRWATTITRQSARAAFSARHKGASHA